MSIKLLVIGLAVTLLGGQTCNASWLTVGSSTVQDVTVKYGVWDGVSGTLHVGPATVGVGSGEFAYIYQVLNPSHPPQVDELRIAAPAPSSLGTIAGQIFDGAGNFAAGSTTGGDSAQYVAGNVRFDLQPPVGTASVNSNVLYFVSNLGPTDGQAMLDLIGRGPQRTISAGVPVPVPVPPAFLLLAMGLPLVGMLKGRMSR